MLTALRYVPLGDALALCSTASSLSKISSYAVLKRTRAYTPLPKNAAHFKVIVTLKCLR